MDFSIYVVVVIEFTEKRLPTGPFFDLFTIRSNSTLKHITFYFFYSCENLRQLSKT